ncbi:cupredoxin domain-containing protein [Streptomyces orinoci]|uniref:Cupredoxin family copper-binding protein n=1 Tax=Streptomyces orinoci TaxID=67339 RepID=A0ABV3K2X5_STRON|nr:cupredoxin family copper-binding protein [Streptomyces orinoci]
MDSPKWARRCRVTSLLVAAVTAASVSTAAAWCGDGHGRETGDHGYSRGPATVAMAPAAPSAPAAASQVTIAGFAFSPSTLTVTKGTTVTWTNNDSVSHTVTGSGLNSPTLSPGDSYSFTFNSSGTFSYICTIHPSMHGTVVVN